MFLPIRLRWHTTYFIAQLSKAKALTKPIRDSLALGISCYFLGIQMTLLQILLQPEGWSGWLSLSSEGKTVAPKYIQWPWDSTLLPATVIQCNHILSWLGTTEKSEYLTIQQLCKWRGHHNSMDNHDTTILHHEYIALHADISLNTTLVQCDILAFEWTNLKLILVLNINEIIV